MYWRTSNGFGKVIVPPCTSDGYGKAWHAMQHLLYAHTARFYFGANVVIQVMFWRLSFQIRPIIRKECDYT